MCNKEHQQETIQQSKFTTLPHTACLQIERASSRDWTRNVGRSSPCRAASSRDAYNPSKSSSIVLAPARLPATI